MITLTTRVAKKDEHIVHYSHFGASKVKTERAALTQDFDRYYEQVLELLECDEAEPVSEGSMWIFWVARTDG